ncbi:helix-turn-helix domain-containing protein [Buttiauxella sp. WJP83]|uniref:helix-turn-helix domain-containing protein n=1 Tax=Buttiauxella sp. WJP83 TaxID=2986951 RepID=UPI0022DE37D8|nr:helix-turn-helix domain-containing protein [Buttiauxella sp. WJP83]WBM68770.1 helix-turn-helix domain-containing protein [Buttiauxella sp. WJP83]
MLNPKEQIQLLVDNLSSNKNIFTKRKNQIVTMDGFTERNVLIFHQGIISGCRPSDDRLLVNFTAPRIFGLNSYIDTALMYFRACTDISYEFVLLAEAEKIIKEKNLWQQVSTHHMLTIANMLKYINNMAGVSSYALVIHCLYQLQAEPEIVRLRRTAADYIVDKSGLSRSTVMKMLAELKAEGKVMLSKGLLMDLKDLE